MRTVRTESHSVDVRALRRAATIAALLASVSLAPALAQELPDFNGVWARDAHNYPKPYLQRGQVIDGYNNEYIKPWVVELIERDELVTAAGRSVVTAHSNCYPESIPYVYGGAQIQIVHTDEEVAFIFGDPGQWRVIPLNVAHPDTVVPSWWGDAVAHFEGDSLVIDTIGIGVFPQAGSMARYGTPHSEALHVIERWRYLREGEVSNAPPPANDSVDAAAIDASRVLRSEFTVEDPLAYYKPWTTTIDYLAVTHGKVREYICEENSRSPDIAPMIPRARTPDF